MADDFQLRRRAHSGQQTPSSVVGHGGMVVSQDVGNAPGQESVSSSSGIANQKTRVVKNEALSPNQESNSEKMRKMRTLVAQAQKLAEEEKMHTELAQQLEGTINRSRLEYGQMIQNSLKLQRAIELKKKHIEEDEDKRRQELSSKQSKTEALRLTIVRMNAITGDDDNG